MSEETNMPVAGVPNADEPTEAAPEVPAEEAPMADEATEKKDGEEMAA